MRAIVIDDSRVARMKLRNALLERGFEVVEAGDGREALDVLTYHEVPHLALVDWNMPEMNGLDFVKAIRANDRFHEMLVMMVTSESEPAQMVRALHAGANEYLMKPYTKGLLFEKLELLGVAGQ